MRILSIFVGTEKIRARISFYCDRETNETDPIVQAEDEDKVSFSMKTSLVCPSFEVTKTVALQSGQTFSLTELCQDGKDWTYQNDK